MGFPLTQPQHPRGSPLGKAGQQLRALMRGPEPPKTPPRALPGVRPAQEGRQCRDGGVRNARGLRWESSMQKTSSAFAGALTVADVPRFQSKHKEDAQCPGGWRQPARCTIRALLSAWPSSVGAATAFPHPFVNFLRSSAGHLLEILMACALIRLLIDQVISALSTTETSHVYPKPPQKFELWATECGFPNPLAAIPLVLQQAKDVQQALLVGHQGSGRVGSAAKPFAMVRDSPEAGVWLKAGCSAGPSSKH